MAEAKKLQCSGDEAIAGVCAGIADRFDVDPLVVRILAVLFAIVTFGLVLPIYAVIWLVIPKRLDASIPIDCAAYVPAELEGYTSSDSCGRARTRSRGEAPVPPVGFSLDEGRVVENHVVQPVEKPEDCPCETGGMTGWSRFCVWVGSIILALEVVAVFDIVVEGVMWWQLWPLTFTVAGFVLMLVPSSRGSRIRRFSAGLSIVSVSVVVLLMTTGLIAWQSAVVAVDKLWPVLLVIAGLLLMRMSLHDDMFNLAIALVVVVVCLAVVFFFAIPGSLEHAVINTPLGVRVYDVNPWI